MRKSCLFFLVISFFFISCGSTKNTHNIEKADIKETDGSYIINNRDSFGAAFLTGDIYISNKTRYKTGIDVLVFGEGTENKPKTILKTTSYKEQNEEVGGLFYILRAAEIAATSAKKQVLSSKLAEFEKIYFVTTNGKITESDVSVKNGSFYITINDYDFNSLSSVVNDANEKIKREKEQEEIEKREKLKKLHDTVMQKGKNLFEQKILAGQSEQNPIIIKSYYTKMDSANGIEVFIDFCNNSNKTIKYVDFEVTPYNRVDDVAYSTIDHISTRIIQTVDYIEPLQNYKAHFQPVWYNNTIAYFKISSIKITYRDGSNKVIPQNKIDSVSKTSEITVDFQNYKKDAKLSLNYDISENFLYIKSVEKGNGSLINYNLDFIFETDIQIVKLGFPKSNVNDDSSITRKYTIDNILLATVTEGYMTEPDKIGMTPRNYIENKKNTDEKEKVFLSDDDIKNIKDFASIQYYVANRNKN